MRPLFIFGSERLSLNLGTGPFDRSGHGFIFVVFRPTFLFGLHELPHRLSSKMQEAVKPLSA